VYSPSGCPNGKECQSLHVCRQLVLQVRRLQQEQQQSVMGGGGQNNNNNNNNNGGAAGTISQVGPLVRSGQNSTTPSAHQTPSFNGARLM